jgi:hypothetical protein
MIDVQPGQLRDDLPLPPAKVEHIEEVLAFLLAFLDRADDADQILDAIAAAGIWGSRRGHCWPGHG